MSLVCAEENGSQEIVDIHNSNDLNSVEEVDVLTSDSEDQANVLTSENDNQITVLSSSEPGSFTELYNKINSATTGVLELDNDYVYSSGDPVGTSGIKINQAITINGNGHYINGSNLARIFNIGAANVVLNNITFVNGNSINGGAIYLHADNCIINNSRFEDNYASSNGGAIYSLNPHTTIDNCNFSDNHARAGGAVYSGGSSLTVKNSDFNHNYGPKESSFYTNYGGGALYSSGSYADISNSTFENNKNSNYGGAVRIDGLYSKLTDSTFENNTGGDGGGVAWHGNYGTLDNCSFFSNYASVYDGGGLSWYSGGGKASNALFENNTANFRGGGAIYQTTNAALDNFTFIGNNASSGGGFFAPATGTSNNANNRGTLSNSRFINNHAFYGGGGADITAHFKIINADFINNTANNYGGAVSLVYAEIIDSNLINNSARFGGGIYSQKSTITDTTFENNNAPYGKSAYVLNSTDFINCVIPDDEITVMDNLTKTSVDVDPLTDNLFNTAEGYYGYCAERFVDNPYEGIYDGSLKFLHNAKNGQPVGEYLKILIYQYVDKKNDLTKYTLEDYVWAFTDFEYWNSTDPVIQDVINIYNSGFRVPTENACKVLPNGTLMYFNFSSIITPAAQQNLFLFKFDYGGIINNTVIKESLNKTVLLGDNAEFRIVVNNKGNSTVFDVFVDDNDYSSGLLYEDWRSEIGNWTYDNLTKKWRLDKLEPGKSASLILVFKANADGDLVNNVFVEESSYDGLTFDHAQHQDHWVQSIVNGKNRWTLNTSLVPEEVAGLIVVFNTTNVGNFTNVVVAGSDETENKTTNNTTKVVEGKLDVKKITINPVVLVGDQVTFEIIVKNTGEIDLKDVFVLESNYGSGLVYLSFVPIKGKWVHSLNGNGKHLFNLDEILKINDTAVFRVIFKTTKLGNFTNQVIAGVNNTNLSNSTNHTKVINKTTNHTDVKNETDEHTDNITDKNQTVKKAEVEIINSKLDEAATGNPILILLLVLILVPIRMFKK